MRAGRAQIQRAGGSRGRGTRTVGVAAQFGGEVDGLGLAAAGREARNGRRGMRLRRARLPSDKPPAATRQEQRSQARRLNRRRELPREPPGSRPQARRPAQW